ncbi:MAG: DEAD/DEAH box helicase [Candidatus Omnitrophica bacterium]|nr:DEAD/DEAH box helicase [Candidatus Omnitrophota bacterium]MCF7877165.1 DEAD/DEAH box helicase [Candidatus Omnitrophota bacterium]MCF7878412.1 DEAD/DEAH box helicase [Candidatus Omnitrophota bacterium]MCF7892863.1 DEAD/DEAH box helicase [Candidatus Omnitrophota bacterium]
MAQFQLDPFQKKSIELTKSQNSVIVSAPTGSGKTLIAERLIEDCIEKNKGIIYTAPIKALSNQKFRDFGKKYPDKVGIVTGDVSINRDAPILIMTTEIFRNAIMVNPEEFKKINWVIFDEIHYLDDIERGTVWEEAIILLPPNMKMLALSATIPNSKEFSGWLKKIHRHPIKVVIENKRPVPLHFFFQCDNGIFTNFKRLKQAPSFSKKINYRSYKEEYRSSRPNKIKTLIKYIRKNKAYPSIYFSFSRRRCEELACELSSLSLINEKDRADIENMFDKLIKKYDTSSSPHINNLRPLLRKGIAYHHAGLLPTVKEIIEQLFTTGLIRLIFTTETFALGINMPVKSVIFDSLSKFYGRYHHYLKTRDFYQMAGRAGRRGIDKEGFVYSRINPSHIDQLSLEKIIYGSYEPIKSQLNSCYATILNLWSQMAENIYQIYPKSLHYYQSKPWPQKKMIENIKSKVLLLKKLGYIAKEGLTPKAQLASNIYSFELAIGELFQQNYLDRLTSKELFVLIVALVHEPRKGQRRPKLDKKTKKIERETNKIIRKIQRAERKHRIYPPSKKFFFHLTQPAQLWFEGAQFHKLTQNSRIDEGTIVRYFRMALQVLRQLRKAEQINQPLKNNISDCIRKTKRDVIDAENQLRQEI